MGFWKDLGVMLNNGEPICEIGKKALANWLAEGDAEKKLSWLLSRYPKSRETLKEVKKMSEVMPYGFPTCEECGEELLTSEERERKVCDDCWERLSLEEEDWLEKE